MTLRIALGGDAIEDRRQQPRRRVVVVPLDNDVEHLDHRAGLGRQPGGILGGRDRNRTLASPAKSVDNFRTFSRMV